jgi:diaminopimelate decarboxylase
MRPGRIPVIIARVGTALGIDPGLKPLLPLTAAVNAEGHLEVGGCDLVRLAREYGTPLYVFDEADLRARAREFLGEFRSRWPEAAVLYAGKAYLGKALARLFAEEGLGLDVVSGGELAVARAAGFPMDRVYLHGNNKSRQELREAVEAGVGTVVIDNDSDIRDLAEAAAAAGRRQAVLLRVTPDVDAHTHAKITTGVLDSKFGLPVAFGMAEGAVAQTMASPHLDLRGLHCHIGSQVFEVEPYCRAVETVLEFAAAMVRKHGLDFRELSPGGGIGLQYVRGEAPPAASVYAEAITAAVRDGCGRLGLPPPRLVVEPGRALVGRAGIALYTAGSRKELPGVRTYVAVDGGMADNVRPAMYGARYEALSAERPSAPAEETVTIAGKYCESGDYLVRDARLPRLREGEVIAIPASGAYCLAMASNYNAALRPPVVFVRDGRARLVRRRETYADLMATEVD